MLTRLNEMCLWIAAGLVCLVPTSALAMEREYDHGVWVSGLVESDEGVRMFRAFSGNDRKSSLNAFFAVDVAADCETVDPNIVILVPDGVDSSGYLNFGSFQLRIDTREIIEGAWTSSANQMGDEVIFVTLITDKTVQLLRDMKYGNTLRVKVEFVDEESDDVIFKYSLDGSAAAINRAYRLCDEYKKSDEQYFR